MQVFVSWYLLLGSRLHLKTLNPIAALELVYYWFHQVRVQAEASSTEPQHGSFDHLDLPGCAWKIFMHLF